MRADPEIEAASDDFRGAPLVALAVAFTRVGLLGFGGGPSFIPLMQRETEARGWLDSKGFLDALAFGNALPGPIATKLAGYIGWRVAGVPGAVVALAGLTVPTIVAIVALINAYLALEHLRPVQAALAGIRPVVLALVALVVIEFAPGALGRAVRSRGFLAKLALGVAAFAAAVGTAVHPGVLILVGGAAGVIVHRATRGMAR